MKIKSVVAFLKTLPHRESGNGSNIMVRCPFCGDSKKNRDSTHFSIKVDVQEGSPLLYQCFQPSYRCGAKGVLTSSVLQKLGCRNMNTLLDLSKYNKSIHIVKDKFHEKRNRQYTLVNPLTSQNIKKAEYVNSRLGVNLTPSEMKALKIQLSLFEFLETNYIRKLSYPIDVCEVLDKATVGFVSAYDDYLICRDITKRQITGRRYTMYRTSGDTSPDDMKLYIIPAKIDIMSPKATVIHLAEGTFSILGAYLHTGMQEKGRNNIYIANCGTGYRNSIEHIAKQYGFCNMQIHIYSDNDVPIKEYEKLHKIISSVYDIESFKIHYNTLKEDFGYPSSQIKIKTCTIR